MDIASVALELYTVRDEMARDFAGTLRKVAAMGYPGVEFSGYGGLTARELKTLLTETKLRADATHVALQALEQDIEQEIATCHELGCAYLVLPWLIPEQRTIAAFRQLAPRLNAFGQKCKAGGITFCYHNHDFEFAQEDGKTPMDIFLAETDPSLVKLEFDIYWSAYAGVDPLHFLQKHGTRIPLIHLKDMTPERSFAEVGDGTLDIAGIIQAAHGGGTQFFIVENDKPAMPSLESAKRSLENLRTL